ncbi:MAG: hypothetical protein GXO10_06115 [Crenarchaeota archaeon]|nr:hypothetical protein [Thermoproteota archaeon]
MPSLSVHLLIGLSLFLLCYLISRDVLAAFLSLVCAIIPDADALFGVHRCFIVHNLMIPVLLISISVVLKIFKRVRTARKILWAGIGYLSHILFDMFTWYVALLYPISNLCVWIESLVKYNGGLAVAVEFHTHVKSCSLLPTGVPSMSDKILIPVAAFILAIVILSVTYGSRRRHHNNTSKS